MTTLLVSRPGRNRPEGATPGGRTVQAVWGGRIQGSPRISRLTTVSLVIPVIHQDAP